MHVDKSNLKHEAVFFKREIKMSKALSLSCCMLLMYAAGIVGGYLNKPNAEVAEWHK